MAQAREEKLAADFESLNVLKSFSTIFDFESEGDPPSKYVISFHGKGIRRSTDADEKIEFVTLHRCEVRLPYSYPNSAPDIRWLTPIFHPNVSFSGYIELDEVGLPWDPEAGLDVVCERLWDVARLSFVNIEDSTNYAAQEWFRDSCEMPLPVDTRPLRDQAAKGPQSNVVKYRRKASGTTMPEGSDGANPVGGDVFFIGEETPQPPAARPAGQDDDDILFIGD